MRCVIYLQSKNDDEIVPNINDQRETMNNMIKSENDVLVKEYFDKENDGYFHDFENMKNDIYGRKFDVIVFYSLDRFGKNTLVAIDFLKNVVIPAHIAFRVICDGFNSLICEQDEIVNYLDRHCHEYMQSFRLRGLKKHIFAREYNQYGYIFSENEMVVDETVKNTIQMIFDKAINGVLPTHIANYLNDNSIETPTQHFISMGKYNRESKVTKWSSVSVMNILRNEIYTGKYVKHFRGEELSIPCPVIVSKSVFEKAKEVLSKRIQAIPKRNGNYSIFAQLLFDYATGKPMVCYDRSRTGNFCYKMVLSKENSPVFSEGKIMNTDLIQKTRYLLSQEKNMAKNVLKYMQSPIGKTYIENVVSKEVSKQKTLIRKIISLNDELFSKDNCDKNSINNQIDNLEIALSEQENTVNSLKIALSDKNPWIKHYLSYDARKELNRETAKKYIKRIEVKEFRDIILTPLYAEWKDTIPKEWMVM